MERGLLVLIILLQLSLLASTRLLRRTLPSIGTRNTPRLIQPDKSGADVKPRSRPTRTEAPENPTPPTLSVSSVPGTRASFPPLPPPLVRQTYSEMEMLRALLDHAGEWDSLPAHPALDMREDRDHYAILLTLPGAQPSDVEVLLEGRLLTIKSASAWQSAHSSGAHSFVQLVQIPGAIGDATQSEASVTNGSLVITIPKGSREDSPRTILYRSP